MNEKDIKRLLAAIERGQGATLGDTPDPSAIVGLYLETLDCLDALAKRLDRIEASLGKPKRDPVLPSMRGRYDQNPGL